MAMTNAGFSDAVKAALIAQKGAPVDSSLLQKFCDGLANGAVPYIQANAQVEVGIPVAVSTVTGIGATTAPGVIE